jgi:hypothetical protein
MASKPSGKMFKPLPPDPNRHQHSAIAPLEFGAVLVIQGIILLFLAFRLR